MRSGRVLVIAVTFIAVTIATGHAASACCAVGAAGNAGLRTSRPPLAPQQVACDIGDNQNLLQRNASPK
jgi:hypothetical protein